MEKTATKNYLLTHDQYLVIKAAWKKHSDAKIGTAWHHLAYLVLLEKNIERAFKPMTNPKKIENLLTYQGREPNYKRTEAAKELIARINVAVRYNVIAGDENIGKLQLAPGDTTFELPIKTLEKLKENIEKIL